MHAPAGFTPAHRRTAAQDAAERGLPHKGGERAMEIDIRLELLEAQRGPGARLTHDEIAAFAGCSDTLILQIERKALRKLRTAAAARGLTLEDLHDFFHVE